MTKIVLVGIKYAIIILMAFYTYVSFRAIKTIRKDTDIIKEKVHIFYEFKEVLL